MRLFFSLYNAVYKALWKREALRPAAVVPQYICFYCHVKEITASSFSLFLVAQVMGKAEWCVHDQKVTGSYSDTSNYLHIILNIF